MVSCLNVDMRIQYFQFQLLFFLPFSHKSFFLPHEFVLIFGTVYLIVRILGQFFIYIDFFSTCGRVGATLQFIASCSVAKSMQSC